MSGDAALRERFASGSEELLDAIGRLLAGPVTDRAAMEALVRAFHSLGRMSGALGAQGMLAVARRCEDILGLACQGRVALAGAAADVLLGAVECLRHQRAALLGEGRDVPAAEDLLARLAILAEAGVAAAGPARAAAPQATKAPGGLPILAHTAAQVVAELAPLAVGTDAASQRLASELAGLARETGAPRLAALLDGLAAPGDHVAPLGELARRLDTLAAITGRDAGATALRRAVAGRAGDAGLPALLAEVAAALDATPPDAGVARAADRAAAIAAALGFERLEALLLAVLDMADRAAAEGDAAVALAERGPAFARRLRDAAAGGSAAMATLPSPEEAFAEAAIGEELDGARIPEAFARSLGADARRRLGEALRAGKRLYRARLGLLGTAEREGALLGWLGAQGAETLATRIVPGSRPPVLELLLAAPADTAALEASRAAFDPVGDLLPLLTPLGEANRNGGAVDTPPVGQEAIDAVLAQEAEVRAAGLALAEALDDAAVRSLPGEIAALARTLPSGMSREAAALAERAQGAHQRLQEARSRLTLSLRRLDEAMTELRVAPLATLFSRLPQVARSMAQSAGKEVEVELAGGEVSIDRRLIEALADPLQHLVRNAVEHGAETPAERTAAGKPPRATLRISAEQHGADRVRIAIADDGRGIDRASVLRTALARGLLSLAEADALDEAGTLALLFRPGFSTSERITGTSGRGVGLAAAQEAVHRAGGTIEVSSRPGEGTRFLLDLPLSAAVAPVLLVEAGGHPYAVPAGRVEAVLEGPEAMAARPKEVVSLEAALGMPVPDRPGAIVVLNRTGGRPLGLAVARVGRRADLLLRPLHPSLASLSAVGAIGVLGTGEPVVVLEPDGIGG